MTNLFDIIPKTLFRPLAAQGAPVYAEVLLRLFEETRRHQRPISRELAINIIAETLTDPSAMEVTSDIAEQVPYHTTDEVMSRSSTILRYLTQNGWLRIETQSDFSHAYTLPMHAFRLLSVLQEIAGNKPIQLQGVICSIHDVLQAAIKENADTIRFQEAHRQTHFLLTSLKELQHNIGVHIQEVLEQLKTKDVLEQMFHAYRNEIVDKAYHQLRTTDHVSRFRPSVLQALAILRQETHIDTMAKQLVARGETQSIREASNILVEQIRDIYEQFENLDRLLSIIDVRHGQFIDSAVRNIEHYLMASSTTSGQLRTILEYLITEQSPASDHPLPDMMEELIDLFHLELIDSGSLAPPRRAAVPFVPEVADTIMLSEEEIEEAHQRTLFHLTRAINRSQVQKFAERLLDGRDEIQASNISFEGSTDLPLLIYLRLYGDGSLGYCIEELAESTWIEQNGIGLRDFVLRRTELS